MIRFNSRTLGYQWLSNFHPSPVCLDNEIYPTVEHAYQAAKTSDEKLRTQIRNAATPQMAKQLGASLTLRINWHAVKERVMQKLLDQKFWDHDDLRRKLRATGVQPLIHYCPWGDTYWGVNAFEQGKNILGEMIMEIRDDMARLELEEERE